MIKRFSSVNLLHWQRHMHNLSLRATVRCFNSTAACAEETAPGGENSSITSPDATHVALDESGATIPTQVQADALRILDSIIRASERGEYTGSWKEAWDLYGRLDEAAKTPQLVRRLVHFLAKSPRTVDARKATRLFKTLLEAERNCSLYSTTIQALLKIHDFGSAVLLHDQALQNGCRVSDLDCSRVVIGYLLGNSFWQLAFHIYDSVLSSFGNAKSEFDIWQRTLFKTVAQIPQISSKVMDFLSVATKHPYLLRTPTDAHKTFVELLVRALLRHGSSFGTRQNSRAILLLKSLDMHNRSTYEQLISLTIEAKSDNMRTALESSLTMYRLYRSEEYFRPSTRILRGIFDRAARCNARDIVAEVLPDWHSFYGLPPKALTGLLMKLKSAQSDAAGIEELLSAHIAQRGSEDLKLLYPLLHAHALRGDPAAVESQFARINDSLKLKPDITCYNILLHAYQRAQDLDGGLSVFSRLLESGVDPDAWTFGTVMALGADRGDIEHCDQLLDMASTSNVPRSAVMNECLILAYLNDNQAAKAESVARTLTLHSSQRVTTRLWNQILIHHCLDLRPQNLKNALHTARLMQKFHIPYDAYTYAAIMRAYVVKRRADTARAILAQVVRKRDIPVLALHYAIVMDGYANQLSTEKGLRMHAEMLALKIKPTVSTRLVLQRLHVQAGERKILIDRSSHPGLRLDIVDESVEEAIAAYEPTLLADREPQVQSSRFSLMERYPATYFDTPLLFYTKIRAFDAVKTLLSKFEASSSTMPLRFIMLLMNLRYHEGDHAEVERYWKLAKGAAYEIAKIASHSRGETYLPVTRRAILARHFDILLRSLSASAGSEAQASMLGHINDLFSLGFDLDNENWNLYIQLLAIKGNFVSAFTLCERHLMGQSPPWREDEPRARFFQATDQKSPGTEYLGPRFTYIRTGELRATFKTMVRFALIVRRLRRAAPFEAVAARQLAELERDVPRTMRAVLEMPMKEHPTATHVLGKRSARGTRRRLDE